MESFVEHVGEQESAPIKKYSELVPKGSFITMSPLAINMNTNGQKYNFHNETDWPWKRSRVLISERTELVIKGRQ